MDGIDDLLVFKNSGGTVDEDVCAVNYYKNAGWVCPNPLASPGLTP